MTASAFHENHEPGGKIYRWRRNGATKTWKTRPTEFQVPIKYGLRDYSYLTDVNADGMHTEDDCPDKQVVVESHKVGCRDDNCHGECLT
jgi:hypothetical protein